MTRHRRRRDALRLGVAGALGVGAQVVDAGGPFAGGSGGAGVLARAGVSRAQEGAGVAGAFLLVAENALWLTRAGGGGRTRLASGTGGWLQDPAWSPDGTQASYTHFRFSAPTGATAPGGVPWPAGEVFALSPATPGAPPRTLLRREALNEALVSASWAPDGRALYAVRRRPLGATAAHGDLLRLDLETGATAVLETPFEATEVSAGPAGMLAVVGITGPAVTGLPDLTLVVRGLGAQAEAVREVVSTAPGAGPPNLGFLSLPRFSPDGRRLAFAAGDGPADGARDWPGDAAWSGRGDGAPAGAGRVGAVLRGALGVRPAAAHGLRGWPWVADLETGALRRLPTGGHDDLAGIAWLPDGERLLVLDVAGLAVVDLAGGALTRLEGATAGLAATALAYAPPA